MKKYKKGFTILEMMVAMAVLSMLVVAMSRIFQQSLVASDTGYNLSKGILVGRTLSQFIADDLSNCTEWLGESGSYEFDKISVASGQDIWQTIEYKMDSGAILRSVNGGESLPIFEPSSSEEVVINDFDMQPDDNHTYIDVFISISIKKFKNGDEDIKNFSNRVYLQNNNRYTYY